MTSPSLRKRAVGAVLLGLVACGGTVAGIDEANTSNNPSSSSSSSGTSTTGTSTATTNPTTTATTTTTGARVPKQHRAVATACDNVRSDYLPQIPDAGSPPVECRAHAECTKGTNGRCVGNGHDGWYCTYDACFADSDCAGGTGLCNCEGGFRSDHNVCLPKVGCHIDTDCKAVPSLGGAGYCSPTLGSCGHYSKAVSYHCHTAADECIDDDDCSKGNGGGRPYCKFEPTVGHWKCSTDECAG